MACFLVLLVASCAGFVADSLESAKPLLGTGEDPLWVIGPVARPLGTAFLWIVPDFSNHDAVENVVSGRNVPLMWVLQSLVILVLIKGLAIAALGCVVLTKRELAQVVA